MKNTNKLLNATKEYFCLESEKDLANFFGIDLCELEKIRVGVRNLSIENKLTILNYLDGLDENDLYIFDKLKTDHLLNEICLLYSLNAYEFIEASPDACLLNSLKEVITKNPDIFHMESLDDNIRNFLGIDVWNIRNIEKGSENFDWIPRLRLFSWIRSQEIKEENCNPFIANPSLTGTIIDSDNMLFNCLISGCLYNYSKHLPVGRQISDLVTLNTLKEGCGLNNELEVALLAGSTAEKIKSINCGKETLNIDERIAIILQIIGGINLQNRITGAYLTDKIMSLGRKRDESLSAIDNLKKYRHWNDRDIIFYLKIKKEELAAIRENKITLDDLPALCRLNILNHLENIPGNEIELAIKSNSYLLILIDEYKGDQSVDKTEKPNSKENHPTPYKPEGLNRILWLAAKNIAIPDPEFGYKDLVLFAMSLHSGCKLGDIRMNDMVDAVICALGEYYRHAGINEINLGNLLKNFRTGHALLVNEKFTQDDGSRKIIEACMIQLMLAPMRSEDKQIVDLGKSDVSYEEVWARAVQEQNEYHEQRVAGIHKKCREDGEAKCLRWYEPVWSDQVTEGERRNMGPDECMCEKTQDRKIRMLCDFKIDDSGNDVWGEY